MTTLREQLRKHERINSVEVNDYGVLHIAKQMDALLEECTGIVERAAREDYGTQKLLAGFAKCEPDSVAIRILDKLKKEGYGE